MIDKAPRTRPKSSPGPTLAILSYRNQTRNNPTASRSNMAVTHQGTSRIIHRGMDSWNLSFLFPWNDCSQSQNATLTIA